MTPKKSLRRSPKVKRDLPEKLKKSVPNTADAIMEPIQEEIEQNEVEATQDDVEQNEEEATQDDAENQLQIMPYVVRSEAVQTEGQSDETSMSVEKGEDILSKTRLWSCFECPAIPLCRLLPYAKVRGLRDDLTGLKVAFGKEGYVPEKGVFIVSLCTCLGETTIVDNTIMSSWDPLWVEINKEFEEEISVCPSLKQLSNHMFYVWEGNHRAVAWMQAIQERFLHRKEKHVRVLSTIIDPRKVSEISLLTCFQRMNFLNTHALVATSLRDELVNTYNICTSNSGDYLKELNDKDVTLIMQIRKKQTKGEEPWFPLTRKYLAKLVYNVQMFAELQKELDPLRVSLSPVELKKVETKRHADLLRKYSDRIGKILNIVDPKLGEEWWQKVLAFKWSTDSYATLEKLSMLAMCNHIPNCTRNLWLTLLEANKVTKAVYALPRGDHDFRSWLIRESVLERIRQKSEDVLKDFMNEPGGLVMPEGLSFHAFFEEIRMEKRKFLFPIIVRLETREKNADIAKLRKYDLFQMAAQRVVYRFLCFLRDGGHLPTIPLGCKQWISPTNEMAVMYTPDMFTLSKWEIENCPWWIDMVKGQVLDTEKQKYDEIYHPIPLDVQQGSLGIPAPKRRARHGVNPIASNMDDVSDMEAVPDVHEKDLGKSVIRKVSTFVFIDKHSQDFVPFVGEQKCLAIVGDYVTIGKDFACGMKSPAYTLVHEHFKGKCPKERDYVRMRRGVSWAADLVFLDLPFGGVLHGTQPHPHWDHLTEDHVRYGIAVAAASLSDRGWLLVMCSSAGPSIGWVERYSRVSSMEIWHRVLVIHDMPYGFLEIAGNKVECSSSILFVIRRQSCEPLLFLEASTPFFRALQLSPLGTMVYHHLPVARRALDSHGGEWRGCLQRSHAFLACYLELLCPHGGIVLELGCGTAPLLEACLHTGRICVSIDLDEALISSCVLPLLMAKKNQQGDVAGSSHGGDDDVDILAGVTPYDDYVLPDYIEKIAKSMVMDPACEVVVKEVRQRRCNFIDDESLEDKI